MTKKFFGSWKLILIIFQRFISGFSILKFYFEKNCLLCCRWNEKSSRIIYKFMNIYKKQNYFSMLLMFLLCWQHAPSFLPSETPSERLVKVLRVSFSPFSGLWLVSAFSCECGLTEEVFKPGLTLMKCLRWSSGAAVKQRWECWLRTRVSVCVHVFRTK